MTLAPRPPRVLVTHHDPLVSVGLAHTLAAQPQLQVTVAPVLPLDLTDIDVVVGSPDLALQWASVAWPRSPTHRPALVVVARASDRLDSRTAQRQTVQAYLTTDCPVNELCHAVLEAANGRHYLSQAFAEHFSQCATRDGLTQRELDVLRSLKAGRSNQSIADDLGVAIGTVKTHVRSIFAKLQAATRTEAMVIAGRRELV